MKGKLFKRFLATIMILALMVMNMPITYSISEGNTLNQSVADMMRKNDKDIPDQEITGDPDTDVTVTFKIPARAILRIYDAAEGGTLLLERDGQDTIDYSAPQGTELYVEYEDIGSGTEFDHVMFHFGDPSEKYIASSGARFEIDMGNPQTLDALPHGGDDQSVNITGTIMYVVSWKDGYSGDADLIEIDPEPTVPFISGTYEYDILVADIDHKPTLNPVASSPVATVDEDTSDPNKTIVTVTAENGLTTKTYTFNFIVRPVPVITLLGDNPDYVVRSDTETYADPEANVSNGLEIDEDIFADDNTVDLTVTETFEMDYNFTDPVWVYYDDDLIQLVADTKTRTIIVEELEIRDPEGEPIELTGYTLYFGNAVPGGFESVDLQVHLPDGVVNTIEVWSYADTDDGIVDLTGMGIVTAVSEGSEMIQVQVEDYTATAKINSLPNNIPVILLNGDTEVDIFIGSTYDDPVTASDPEEGDLTEDITTTSEPTFDNMTLGEYTWSYTVTDAMGNLAEEERTVNVVKRPVESVEIRDPEGNEITVDGFTMVIGDRPSHVDNMADLVALILPEIPEPTFTAETWMLIEDPILDPEYEVMVSSDILELIDTTTGEIEALAFGYQYIKVVVDDKEAFARINVVTDFDPEVALIGEDELNLFVGSDYIDEGVIASDFDDDMFEDDDKEWTLTTKVYGPNPPNEILPETPTITMDEITDDVGDYLIVYTITDSNGHTASVEREITVYSIKIISVEVLATEAIERGESSGDYLPDEVWVTLDQPYFNGEEEVTELLVPVVFPDKLMYEPETFTSDDFDLPDGIGNPDGKEAEKRLEIEDVIIVDNPESTLEAEGLTLLIGYLQDPNDAFATLYTYIQTYLNEVESVEWAFAEGEPTDVISLDSESGYVVGLKDGQVKVEVKVTLDDESVLMDDVMVYVIDYPEPDPDPEPEPEPDPDPRPRRVVSIKLDRDPVELEYGSEALPELLSFDLTETITGSSSSSVTWSIGDDTIATVDDEGVVTAVRQGETTVTVKHTASGKTASSTVIVFLVGDEPNPLGLVEFYDPYVYGYPDQSFRPKNSVTRAEVATMFAKILALNVEYTGEQQFDDVQPNAWYYNYVQAIRRTNIFVGDTEGMFRPDEPITRAEMATVFGKFWEYLDTPVKRDSVDISDVDSTHWASAYIYMMYNAGIVTGFPDGTYKPNDPTLREQVVGMINTLIARPEFEAPLSKFTDIDNSHWAFGNIEAASQPFSKLQNYPIPE